MSKYDALGTGVPPTSEFKGLYDTRKWNNIEIPPLKGVNDGYRRPKELPAEIVIAQEITTEAHASLAEARTHDEDYSLEKASAEEMFTMARAVEYYGGEVADKSGADPKKIDIAHVQLSDALAKKMRVRGAPEEASVDGATIELTAISLAKMREATPDTAEGIIALDALKSLRQVGDLERMKRQEALGPHTGELAVAAITGYEPVPEPALV